MIILKILSFILIVIAVVIVFAFAMLGLYCLSWFYWKACKHCGHTMEYKGLKEDSANGHYLFHCPKCGAWQQIPKEQFFRDVEDSEVIDPYNNNVL